MELDFEHLIPKQAPEKKERDLSTVATAEALAAGSAEISQVPFQPIDSASFKKEPTRPDVKGFLDNQNVSDAFAEDVGSAIAASSQKYISPAAVKSLGQTPREVLNSAVASGMINPDFTPPEDMGALTPYWRQYKADMEDDVFGAIYRGAKESALPSIMGFGGAVVGSLGRVVSAPLGLGAGLAWGDTIPEKAVGAAIGLGVGLLAPEVTGGLTGSAVGAMLRDELFPPTQQDRAQAIFDAANLDTRVAKLFGGLLPALSNVRPGLAAAKDMVKSAIIQGSIDVGMLAEKMYKGEKLKPSEFLERLTADLLVAVGTKPYGWTRKLFDKTYREQATATKRRDEILRAVASENGMSPENLELAAREIESALPLITEGVNLGAGNMSRSVAMIGMQAALERKASRLLKQRLDAKSQISKDISGTLAEQGESGRVTQEYFKKQKDELLTHAELVRQQIVATGDVESGKIWSEAKAEIQQIGDLVSQNVLDAESALAASIKVLNRAKDRYSIFNGSMNGEDAARSAKTEFETNEKLSENIYKSFLSEIRKSKEPVVTDFANAYRVAMRLSAPVSRKNPKGRAQSEIAQGIPLEPEIEGIKTIAVPNKNGSRKTYSIEKLQAELARVNSAIRNADPGSPSSWRLQELKTAILDDLNKMGDKSELLRNFLAAYKIHADKYDNKKAAGLSKLNPSQFIDHFMRGSVEDKRQLRAALSDPYNGSLSPEMVEAMEVWLLNSLNSKIGVDPKAGTLADWYKENKSDSTFDAFPELRGKTESIINQISEGEAAVAESMSRKRSAETYKEDTIRFLNLRQRVAEKEVDAVKKMSEKEGDKYITDSIKDFEATAAAKFLGPEPDNGIKQILENEKVNRIEQLAELVNAARQDESGAAFRGIQNAFRMYLKKRFSSNTDVTKTNDPKAEVSYEDFEQMLKQLNRELNPDNVYRQAMDMILTPQEIDAIKFTRRQLEVLSRKYALTQGESSTQFSKSWDFVLDNALAGNVTDVLSKAARGIDPTPRAAATQTVEKAINLVKTLWQGDVQARTKELLVDAMIDPKVSIEVLRNVNTDNLPRIRSFLRAWTLSKENGTEYEPLPFGVTDVTEEQLANGTVTTDIRYGYKVIQTKLGNFNLVSPAGNDLGIFKDKQQAEQKAVDDFNKKILNQK